MSSQRYSPNIAGIKSAFGGPTDFNGKIPLLFQIVSPDRETLLLPEALFLHVNPSSLSFSHQKEIARIQTRGGYHEQHWGDQLSEVSASQASGAFINVETGLTVARNRDTIANEKFYQIKDLFHNQGNVHDDRGNVVYRGFIRLIWMGGVYDGYFMSFSIEETADSPFSLSASWTFKVEREAQSFTLA